VAALTRRHDVGGFAGDVMFYFAVSQLVLLRVFFFKTKMYFEGGLKSWPKGSFIIISNHQSFWDGIVIVVAIIFRRMHFLATDFYGNKRKFLKGLVRASGGILVTKGDPRRNYLEECARMATRGRPILIFPEGDFTSADEPGEFFKGYIRIALRTGAKIVPVVNDFNYGLFKRVHLMVGKSIDLSRYAGQKMNDQEIKELNDEIRAKFMTLFHELKRIK